MPHQPRKRFAQHWLRSDKVLNQIVTAADLKESDRILEIGPGTGILTHRLLPQVQTVLAIEIDKDLCQKLVHKLGQEDNFLVLQGDILDVDIEAQIKDFPKFKNPNKVVANIPYNITGPILEYLLGTIAEPRSCYESIVLLLQKEIADRLCAKPGTKAYNALSVRIQYLATCELICDVPPKAFFPPPKVDSGVVRICPQLPPLTAKNPRYLETLVKLGFANKRKMLRNNLKGLVDRDQLTQLLEQLKINPQARAEVLSVENWVTLSNELSKVNINK